MKLPHDLSVPRAAGWTAAPVCLDILGHGVLQATPDQIPGLRAQPGPPVRGPLPTSFLKHADEQTVVGLGAVFHAVHDHGLREVRFTDWGILGAPRHMGRLALAVALQRYKLEGAWGMSPHLIPHRSLHSVSGSVSQALAIHGPNFGVSGGPHAADEALLVAATLLTGDRLPGVWVVLTGYCPEPVPERPGEEPGLANGRPRETPVCRAVALALTPARPGSPHLKLHVSSGPVDEDPLAPVTARGGFSLEALFGALHEPGRAAAWQLHCGGWVALKRSGAGAEN